MDRQHKTAKTYETLGTSVYDADQQHANREPRCRIFGVEISERDDPQLLDGQYTGHADYALHRKQKESHVELLT